MFTSQTLVVPKKQSLILTVIFTFFAFFGSHFSHYLGYITVLTTLLAMIAAVVKDSFWPTKKKAENTLIFSLLWSGLIGAVLPFLIKTFLEGEIKSVFEIFK